MHNVENNAEMTNPHHLIQIVLLPCPLVKLCGCVLILTALGLHQSSDAGKCSRFDIKKKMVVLLQSLLKMAKFSGLPVSARHSQSSYHFPPWPFHWGYVMMRQ